MPLSRLALDRRRFLATGAAAGALASGLAMPAFSRAAARPVFTHGVQSGDVDTASGMIWTRVDRPARVMMEFATTESFADAVRLAPLNALPDSDLAVKRLLEGLPSDQEIFYRMVAADLADINLVSEPIVGRFRTAPASRRSVRFAWSGDTAGQGWGIDAVRHEDLRHDRRPPARLLPAFRRHDLCRRRDDGPRRAARRQPSGPTSS